MNIDLRNGDSLEVLKGLEENSVDSIVTDPPYGLSFMGKKWDYDVPSKELWVEAMRVLKPGGHLLSFAGSRTYHRMAVNIEDAGFDIRDQIMWVYGSGFPKSHNIGKAVDKLQGNERKVIGEKKQPLMTNHYGKGLHNERPVKSLEATKGTSPYEGWGTALKPAHEPIVVARKPLSEKTIAKNVLEWGTGGINIDGCRVGTETIETKHQDRFPANFIHDGSEEVNELLGEPARFFYCAKASKKDRNEGLERMKTYTQKELSPQEKTLTRIRENGTIGENTYLGKTAEAKNNHPTVKPTKLMQYLVRLVTPKGGTVLDPFMGSGSTGKACKLEEFNFIGIDLDPEYVKIAQARIENA